MKREPFSIRVFSSVCWPAALLAVFSYVTLALGGSAGQWTIQDLDNSEAPGRKVDVQLDGKPVARFIYGQGQAKPYLHVFGEQGELLTNPGLNEKGDPTGAFPHHRGIYIGWKVNSELGSDDLWHMTRGCKMEVAGLDKIESGKNGATLTATVLWRSARKDSSGSDLLLSETRTIRISKPEGKRTQIDTEYILKAARDLQFAGDLQHSGVHFRAANEVATRERETSYLFEPDKMVKGNHFKWCRLLFPIGAHWYAAQEMSAPENPVEELSMRNYGRFGYFFKKSFKSGETFPLNFRFVVEKAEAPANKPKPSEEQIAQSRAHSELLYQTFLKELGR